jgi:hypothetical protein
LRALSFRFGLQYRTELGFEGAELQVWIQIKNKTDYYLSVDIER